VRAGIHFHPDTVGDVTKYDKNYFLLLI